MILIIHKHPREGETPSLFGLYGILLSAASQHNSLLCNHGSAKMPRSRSKSRNIEKVFYWAQECNGFHKDRSTQKLREQIVMHLSRR